MKKYQKRVIFEERSYLWRSVIFGSVCENTWNKYRTFLNLNFCSYLGRCLYNIYWEKSERINKKQLRRYSITPSCRILKLFATTNAPPSSSRKYHVELGNHCLKTLTLSNIPKNYFFGWHEEVLRNAKRRFFFQLRFHKILIPIRIPFQILTAP